MARSSENAGGREEPGVGDVEETGATVKRAPAGRPAAEPKLRPTSDCGSIRLPALRAAGTPAPTPQSPAADKAPRRRSAGDASTHARNTAPSTTGSGHATRTSNS